MSSRTRGLFDPRRRMQNWPEPHDDPNIPYVWGQGTTNLGSTRGDWRRFGYGGAKKSTLETKSSKDITASGSGKSKKLWWILGGVSVVGLGVGVYMYTKL